MGPGEYQNLLLHMEWADASIWDAALKAPALQADPQMRERFLHFHGTQWAYLQSWRGEPLSLPEVASFPDLASVCNWARRYYRELAGFRDTLSDAALREHVAFTWLEQVTERYGDVGPATLGETILQVIHHTTHHRGQVATRLRDRGCEAPLMDFIAWVWMRKPPPRWPGVEK